MHRIPNMNQCIRLCNDDIQYRNEMNLRRFPSPLLKKDWRREGTPRAVCALDYPIDEIFFVKKKKKKKNGQSTPDDLYKTCHISHVVDSYHQYYNCLYRFAIWSQLQQGMVERPYWRRDLWMLREGCVKEKNPFVTGLMETSRIDYELDWRYLVRKEL